MVFCHDVREGQFGERFSDTDDGFELSDGDGDAGADVGGSFGFMNATADRYEM